MTRCGGKSSSRFCICSELPRFSKYSIALWPVYPAIPLFIICLMWLSFLVSSEFRRTLFCDVRLFINKHSTGFSSIFKGMAGIQHSSDGMPVMEWRNLRGHTKYVSIGVLY